MSLVSVGFTSTSGEPQANLLGRQLELWPAGKSGPLLVMGVTEWYALAAAVNAAIEEAS